MNWRPYLIGGVAGLVLGAFGTYAANPPRTEHDVALDTVTQTVSTSTFQYIRIHTRNRTRKEFYPDGTPKAEEAESEEVHESGQGENQQRQSARVEFRDRTVVVKDDKRHHLVGLFGLAVQPGLRLRLVYGGSYSYRFAGPFTVGGTVLKEPEQFVGLISGGVMW